MADLSPLGFAPETTEDMGDGFKVVPPATYKVVIVDSDVKDTKKGNGKVLELKCQIVEGAQVGNTVVDRLNIVNPSEISQKIGLSQLKNICDAIGHKGQLTNSEQLHGKPFAIKVVIEQFQSSTSGKMLDSNKIEKRMSVGEAARQPVVQEQQPQQMPEQKQAIGW